MLILTRQEATLLESAPLPASASSNEPVTADHAFGGSIWPLSLDRFVQDEHFDGFALDAVEFHGFLKRIHISGFHANRNLLSCNCVLGWSLEVISQEDIAVRLEACLPL